jgi:hypothetical protein
VRYLVGSGRAARIGLVVVLICDVCDLGHSSPQDRLEDVGVLSLFFNGYYGLYQNNGDCGLYYRTRAISAEGSGLAKGCDNIEESVTSLELRARGLTLEEVVLSTVESALQLPERRTTFFSLQSGRMMQSRLLPGSTHPNLLVQDWSQLPEGFWYLFGRAGPLPAGSRLVVDTECDDGVAERLAEFNLPSGGQLRLWYDVHPIAARRLERIGSTGEVGETVHFLEGACGDSPDIVAHPTGVVRLEADSSGNTRTVKGWFRVECKPTALVARTVSRGARFLMYGNGAWTPPVTLTELAIEEIDTWALAALVHQRYEPVDHWGWKGASDDLRKAIREDSSRRGGPSGRGPWIALCVGLLALASGAVVLRVSRRQPE